MHFQLESGLRDVAKGTHCGAEQSPQDMDTHRRNLAADPAIDGLSSLKLIHAIRLKPQWDHYPHWYPAWRN